MRYNIKSFIAKGSDMEDEEVIPASVLGNMDKVAFHGCGVRSSKPLSSHTEEASFTLTATNISDVEKTL